jgi:hypothetical protein
MGRVAKPKAPPAAPEAVAKALCNRCDPPRGVRRIVRNATFRAISRLLEAAVVIAFEAEAGSTPPMSSIGFPAILARRAARPGCSRDRTALRNAARSSGVMLVKSNPYRAAPRFEKSSLRSSKKKAAPKGGGWKI